MSGKGNCYDNASVETFFKSLKAELIWRQSWPTRRQAEAAIFQYINGFYNTRRRHSYLGGISPLLWKRDGIDHTPASRRDVIPYCRHWNSFYGGTDWRWHNELWVWVIEFDLLKEGTRS